MADLYLDHGVALAIIPLLQANGHTVITAKSLGLAGAGDDEHLLTAMHLGRTLVTYDADFIVLHNAWRRWSADWRVSPQHFGVLLTPQPPVSSALQGAHALNAILASGYPLTNQLYRWTAHSGWIHHPNP